MKQSQLARYVLISAIVLLPLVAIGSGDGFLIFVAGITYIHMLYATGLNLLYGFTGLIPLTYAGIAGVSAYTCVNLVQLASMPFWLALPIGGVAGAAVGLVLSLPAMRLRGFYFALSGMVIQSAITIAFVYFPKYTNGDTGLSSIPRPSIGGVPIASPTLELLLGLLAAVAVGVVFLIMRSRFGASLIAIREDEDLSRALGIDVARDRTIAFVFASFVAGIAGGLYAHYLGFASPRSFDLLISLNLWLMVAVGGRGTFFGPLLGALLLAPLPYFLQQYSWLSDIIYGAAIISVTLFLPNGIYGAVLSKARK